MFIRQLFDTDTSTYTYLVFDEKSKQAAIIDPVFELLERDLKLINELGLSLIYIMETHIHADHITSAYYLREAAGGQIVVPVNAKATNIDHEIQDGEVLSVGNINIKAITTAGHTEAHMAYLVDKFVMTGDALLIRGCGRTDFQGGNAGQLYDLVTKNLFSLPDDTIVYPAHDYLGRTSSTIAEEKQHNPRFSKSRAEFIELMENLNLALPRRIKYAVPANLRAGYIVV